MAVTRDGQIIKMTAADDAVTGRIKIQAIILDHTAAVAAAVVNTAGNHIVALRTTSSKLTEEIVFPCPIISEGVKASALSGGTLTVVLV